MPESVEQVGSPPLTRRERFRAFMRQFNPGAAPREAIEGGLVIEEIHGGVHKHLAARADLEPGSQQLVVGGVGSGKTTVLLLAEKTLAEDGLLPVYVDVPRETELVSLGAGTLVAGLSVSLLRRLFLDRDTGGRLIEQLPKDLTKSLFEFAYGKPSAEPPERVEPASPESSFSWQPGKLRWPFPALQRDLKEIKKPLNALLEASRRGRDPVAIFDGLDRLMTTERFWQVVEQDFRLLRDLTVSVISAAPLAVLFEPARSVMDQFDRVHHLTPLGPHPWNRKELRAVLDRRDGSNMIGDGEKTRLCETSGGVLRDLITLARDAGEEASLAGSERIESAHVETAVSQLGLSYLRGLGPTQLEILRSLRRSGVFRLTEPAHIELLATRRVLEYSVTDFRVHPSLAPWLDFIDKVIEKSGNE
ncbi:MAG: hypothetical protein RMK57_15425 [Bryobacterales bacterium]|nr:hypothetical protein [Bryobacteraceae bacterium]MDW8355912.1 hypothetical protein [Bryobacterales bacterium]